MWQHHRYFLAVLCILTGCQPAVEFGVVRQVKLDGSPLPDATISFISEDESLVPALAWTDENGKFVADTDGENGGLAPGTYLVRITTFDEGDAEADPPLPSVPERVPSKYNFDSELTVVVEPTQNEFQFDLDSKGTIEQ